MLNFNVKLKLSDYKSHKVIRIWDLYKIKKNTKKDPKKIQLYV